MEVRTSTYWLCTLHSILLVIDTVGSCSQATVEAKTFICLRASPTTHKEARQQEPSSTTTWEAAAAAVVRGLVASPHHECHSSRVLLFVFLFAFEITHLHDVVLRFFLLSKAICNLRIFVVAVLAHCEEIPAAKVRFSQSFVIAIRWSYFVSPTPCASITANHGVTLLCFSDQDDHEDGVTLGMFLSIVIQETAIIVRESIGIRS